MYLELANDDINCLSIVRSDRSDKMSLGDSGLQTNRMCLARMPCWYWGLRLSPPTVVQSFEEDARCAFEMLCNWLLGCYPVGRHDITGRTSPRSEAGRIDRVPCRYSSFNRRPNSDRGTLARAHNLRNRRALCVWKTVQKRGCGSRREVYKVGVKHAKWQHNSTCAMFARQKQGQSTWRLCWRRDEKKTRVGAR